MRTGVASLPLHGGKAPPWLFTRMKKLSAEIIYAICREFGPHEFLKRISHPFWFQSLACVLGFDWHSSGTTTTVCGALKAGLKKYESELPLRIAGGKGLRAMQTPKDIELETEKGLITTDLMKKFQYASRMSAKVDNTAIQDGFQIYQHSFFYLPDGTWSVVQQGMNGRRKEARRYHWYCDNDNLDFTNEPHNAICCNSKLNDVLDLTAQKSLGTRKILPEIINEQKDKIWEDMKVIQEKGSDFFAILKMPRHHWIRQTDLNTPRLLKTLRKVWEAPPENFESLLSVRGVGPKTLRALTLVSEVIYGATPSFDDPVRYSFAHGGKDGTPFPVERNTYDKTIEVLRKSLAKADLEKSEKMKAFKRLSLFTQKIQ